MQFVASGNSCWAPNPLPERGSSYSIDSNSDGSKLVYGSGYSVVVRDVANPTLCDVYSQHKKQPKVVKFHPNGNLVASGDIGGVVHVFEASGDMKTKKEIPALGGPIFDIDFDDSGKRMGIVGDAKGTTGRCFMWESGSPQGEIAGSSKRSLSVSIRHAKPCQLVTGSEDFKVRFHGGPPFKFSHTFEKHKNFVQCVRYSPDGALCATASSDKMIYLLDGENGTEKSKLPMDHKGSIYCVAWAPDGKSLLSCSGDKTVKLWDVEAGKAIWSLSLGNSVDDMQVGCTMAGSQPISLSLSGEINFIDAKAGKLHHVVQSHTSTPTSLARDWAGDGAEVYCGTMEGDLFAFSRDGSATKFEGQKPGSNDGLCVNKGTLVSVGHDDTLRNAKVGDGKYSFTSSCSIGGQPKGVSAGPADPELAVTCTEDKVMLCRGGRCVDTKAISGYKATCCAMSEDATEVAVGGSDKAAHIFNVSGDKLEATDKKLGGLQGAVSCIAYSPTGKHIAIGDKIKEVTLWDRDTKEVLIQNKWVFHQAAVSAVEFSPSGQFVASVSLDSRLIIWNVEKKMKKTRIHPAHHAGCLGVCWIDDKTVASSGRDDCIRLWTPDLPQ